MSESSHKGDLQWLEAEIQAILDRNVQKEQGPPGALLPPGAAASIKMNDGDDTMLFQAGYADPIEGTPMRADALFEIGSVTKNITAAAILKYQQTPGFNLNLNDTLEFYLARVTEWEGINPKATLWETLQQTAGTGDFPSTLSSAAPFTGEPETRERHSTFLTRNIFGHSPEMETPTSEQDGKGKRVWIPYQVAGLLNHLAFPDPGKQWAYSNGNYLLAGMVWLELANSPLLHHSMDELFKIPLGLKDFYYPPSEPFDVDRLSVGWKKTKKLDPHLRTAYYTSYGTAGGMVASPRDLASYIQDLFSGNKVLNPETKAEMLSFTPVQSPVTGVPGFDWVGYGLGTIQYSYKDPKGQQHDVVGHGGATAFFFNNAVYIPALNKSVCIFFNQGVDDNILLQVLFSVTRDIITALWEYDPPQE